MPKIFLSLVLLLTITGILLFLLSLFKMAGEKKTKPVPNGITIRKPAAAGTFYPSDKAVLEKDITKLLNEAPAASQTTPRILLVPHAGLAYSGAVAAAGFKQLEKSSYTTAIILGVSHHNWLKNVAIDDSSFWQTPLGNIEINQELIAKLTDPRAGIVADQTSHREEHSLEMEVIFLQKINPEVQIVPILAGQPEPDIAEKLAQKIASVLDEKTVLIISTDLSHYPPADIARHADRITVDAILSGEPAIFNQKVQEVENGKFPGLETAACGQEAIKIGLRVGQIIGIRNWREIKSANSGDSSGEQDQTVGYTAIAGYINEEKPKFALNKQAQKEALSLARRTLEQYLKNGKIPEISPQNPALAEKLGVFVTLRKEKQLRGCIGRFEPDEPLWQVIQQMTVAAATEDPRFPPVTADELAKLKIEISVLTPKEKAIDWHKVVLGQDGVVIRQGSHSGTFLPQVATETGWNLEEFLAELCEQKAGLSRNCYLDPKTEIYVFQAQVFEEE